jgi:hypothetical protein
MNYKEYLELFAEDFNLIFNSVQKGSTKRAKEHLLRIQVMTFHLHVDYLLNEIIKNKFATKMSLSENKKNFDTKDMEFMEKLRLVCSGGEFSEDLFNTFRILNNVRNHLSHNLIVELDKEEGRIKSLKMPDVISKEELRGMSAIEHLFYSSIGCINSLAEYLHKNIFSEKLLNTLNIVVPPANTNRVPVVSVVMRPACVGK